MKKFKLTFNGEVFYAPLLTEAAPKSVAAFEAACPFEAKVQHALIVDNELLFKTPAVIEEIENPVYLKRGDISFFSIRQTVCMFYGEMVPLCFDNKIAYLEEDDIQRLAKMGPAVWEKNGGTILVEIVED